MQLLLDLSSPCLNFRLNEKCHLTKLKGRPYPTKTKIESVLILEQLGVGHYKEMSAIELKKLLRD